MSNFPRISALLWKGTGATETFCFSYLEGLELLRQFIHLELSVAGSFLWPIPHCGILSYPIDPSCSFVFVLLFFCSFLCLFFFAVVLSSFLNLSYHLFTYLIYILDLSIYPILCFPVLQVSYRILSICVPICLTTHIQGMYPAEIGCSAISTMKQIDVGLVIVSIAQFVAGKSATNLAKQGLMATLTSTVTSLSTFMGFMGLSKKGFLWTDIAKICQTKFGNIQN